jgi:nitrite reductase/ring-hydroxylating ferredoxin subunit
MKKIFVFIMMLGLIVGCEPDLTDDEIPWQPFDVIQINLNLPEYIHLKSDGNSMNLDDGGVRGIIIYHKSGSDYVAYERNCSFQPNTACATVEVHVSTLYIFCPCCSSTFDLATGNPTGGVAWRPLRQYETSFDGSTLTITDQIVE